MLNDTAAVNGACPQVDGWWFSTSLLISLATLEFKFIRFPFISIFDIFITYEKTKNQIIGSQKHG